MLIMSPQGAAKSHAGVLRSHTVGSVELRQTRAAPLPSLEIRVLTHRMVGLVAYATQLGNTLHQRLLDTVLKGEIHRRATLAATAEFQRGDLVFGELDQRDIAAVRGKARVDFRVEVIVDLLFQRGVRAEIRHFGTRGAESELAAQASFL